TRPLIDELEPSLQPAWDELLKTFGASNVLIVSNSAGTGKDSLLLQAESVSRNLRVPVLVHPTPKPGPACARAVATHFLPSSSSLPPRAAVVWSTRGRALLEQGPPPKRVANARILVIGDRVTTDMIMAERIAKLGFKGVNVDTISVLTTTLHAREGLGTTLLRTLERIALWGLERRRKGNLEIAKKGVEEWEDCLISAPTPVVAPSPPPPVPTPAPESVATKPTPSSLIMALLHRIPLPKLPTIDVPRFLASLHSPLSRLTSLWSPPPPTALDGVSSKGSEGDAWTPTSKWGELFSREQGAVGVAERAVDSGEKVIDRLRARVGMRS
ncbi:mitochondrial PGP phosphatase-domain-containing protein, partial [Leucosporidium creatinivorum]